MIDLNSCQNAGIPDAANASESRPPEGISPSSRHFSLPLSAAHADLPMTRHHHVRLLLTLLIATDKENDMARSTKSRHEGARRTGALTIGRHTRTRCPSTGKLRLRDSHQAAHALQSARWAAALELSQSGHANRREASFYNCRSCNGYHLTSEVRRDPEEWRLYCQTRREAERMAYAAAAAERRELMARHRRAAVASVHAAAVLCAA